MATDQKIKSGFRQRRFFLQPFSNNSHKHQSHAEDKCYEGNTIDDGFGKIRETRPVKKNALVFKSRVKEENHIDNEHQNNGVDFS